MSNMPQMKRAINGTKPVSVHCTLLDDGTGSGKAWSDNISRITSDVLDEVTKRFYEFRCDYVVMRDREIGEHDEERLRDAKATDVLREQKLVVREGGGDADETFFWSIEDYLSDASRIADSSPMRARALLMFTTSSSKPARGNSIRALGKEIRDRRIYLFVIGTPGSNMEELVDAAGERAFFFSLDASPSREEALQIAQRLAATISATVGSQLPDQQ